MDTLLLGITVVSLVVALVMSVTAWRLMRAEKQRSAARIAALSWAASDDQPVMMNLPIVEDKPIAQAPWKPAPYLSTAPAAAPASLKATPEPVATHATGFLGVAPQERDSGNRQKTLALAAVVFFVCLAGATAWLMSAPEGTSPVAVGPNSPLELVSLSHSRQNEKLSIAGLVRNPAAGKPVERLSAVVFLFDRTGTFVTSSKAHVDFLRLGAGDESPFVVSIDAPATVSRYRVSFRTDEGVVPHIDRRGESPAPLAGEQAIAATSAR